MMFTTSTNLEALTAALAKAQAEISVAIKDKKNPAFRSTYASFDSVLDACRPALVKHGICVTQWPIHTEDNRVHLVTRIAHLDQWMQSQFSIPIDKHNAHGYGSALTYLKRFCYSAAIGVSTDLDDDGNLAVQYAASNPMATQQQVKPPSNATQTGFDPLNKVHTDTLEAACMKRKITGLWKTQLYLAMKGKPFTELEAMIKATNPEGDNNA